MREHEIGWLFATGRGHTVNCTAPAVPDEEALRAKFYFLHEEDMPHCGELMRQEITRIETR